jgi:transposase
MNRFVEGVDRGRSTLIADCLEDWIITDSLVRVIDVFVDELDLGDVEFGDPEATGRPSYRPTVLLKLYIYGFNRAAGLSARRRHVEVMWLTGRLVPDHKTIADFGKDNGKAMRQVCARFVDLCRQMGLLACAERTTECASRVSSSMLQRARICGPTASKAGSKTSSICRTA